tara:strand:+ start:1813 stop:2934 length:1122 start_codon:yes stop_codon:yes gene_type:complete
MIKEYVFEECLQKIKTPKKLPKKKYLEKGHYPVVAQEEALINGYTDDKNLLYKVEDTLIIFGDHTRHLKLVDFDFVLGADGVKILKPIEDIDTKYFYYYLRAQMPHSLGYARHYKLLKKLSFLIPPLPVQKQIVEKLDAAFADIDKAISATEKNIENAEALFDKSVSKIFVENTFEYETKRLSDISEYFNGLTYSPKDVSPEGVIVLRSSNIQDNKMDYKDLVRVNKKFKDKLYVLDSDILICSRNGSKRLIGKSSIIGKYHEKMTFGTFMMIVRSEYNEYLKWFFISSLFKKQISRGENTMINQITRYMLDEVIVPFPADNEKKEISLNLNSIYESTSKLIDIYRKKLEHLDSLKTSFLNQAFSGELTKDAA